MHETAFYIMKLADSAQSAASDITELKKAETLKEPHETVQKKGTKERKERKRIRARQGERERDIVVRAGDRVCQGVGVVQLRATLEWHSQCVEQAEEREVERNRAEGMLARGAPSKSDIWRSAGLTVKFPVKLLPRRSALPRRAGKLTRK